MEKINISPAIFNGEWNYTIRRTNQRLHRKLANAAHAILPAEKASEVIRGYGTVKQKKLLVIAASAILTVSFLIYGATLSFQLVWDDRLVMDALRPPVGKSPLLHAVSIPMLPDTEYYRPMVMLSLKADEYISRAIPYGFHLTNVVLHGAVSFLVFLFILPFCNSWLAAFLAAVLFAATPLHLESVAFVSGRTDLMAALFILVAAITWQRNRWASPIPLRAVGASAVAYLFAILSKETALLLPAVLLVWSFLDNPETSLDRRMDWRSNVPWVVGWTTALAVALLMRFLSGLSFPQGVNTSPALLAKLWAAYARLLIVPWPLKTYYTDANLPVAPQDMMLSLLLPLALLAAWYVKAPAAGGRAIVWILFFLLPVAGFQRPTGAVLATRFAYIPSIGMGLLAALFLDLLLKRPHLRRVTIGAVLVLAATMGVAVHSLVRPWRSNDTLYEALLRDAPEVPVINFNLANLRRSAGQIAEAEVLYRRALQFDPGYRDASLNLGLTLVSQGRHAEAEEIFHRLLHDRQDDKRVYGNLGNISYGRGRFQESESYFRKTTELDPQDPMAHYSLGLALERLGRGGEAATHFRRALELKPELESARAKLYGTEAAGVQPRIP